MAVPDLKQWRELTAAMKRPSDRDDCIKLLQTMPTPPTNVEGALEFLRSKIQVHTDLYGTDRTAWRSKFYTYLPYRQAKKYLEKNLGSVTFFNQLLQSITLAEANRTAGWGFKEFWQKSLASQCVYRNGECVESFEQKEKRIKYTVPEVQEDEKEILGGRSPLDVRMYVLKASAFTTMKLVTKYKQHKEPENRILEHLGKHMFQLASNSYPECGRRRQNV